MAYDIDSALIERFWECWEWMAARNPYRGDYGIFTVKRKTVLAQRVAWEIANGPIPDGLLVCHACDNPPCVRPDHLFLGSDLENNLDMVRKGRKAPAARKFADGDIRLMRFAYAAGVSMRSLAVRYDIDRATMRAILTRKTYASVT